MNRIDSLCKAAEKAAELGPRNPWTSFAAGLVLSDPQTIMALVEVYRAATARTDVAVDECDGDPECCHERVSYEEPAEKSFGAWVCDNCGAEFSPYSYAAPLRAAIEKVEALG